MRFSRIFLGWALFTTPMLAVASVAAKDFPADTSWYFHADFEEMRASPSGARLYEWLDAEVFEEIRQETGVDLAKEADRVTAFSADGSGAVLVLDGRISQATRDKALAIAAGSQRFETLESRGKTYYYVLGDGGIGEDDIEIHGVDKELYFSFAVKNKLLVASKKEQMQALLASGGKLPRDGSRGEGFIVLTAERSLIQAGMKPDEIGHGESGFESNILRNTRQVALVIADVAGKIAIEAQLMAREPELAQSLASIVRGLIALQAFSDEIDPELSAVLSGAHVDVNDALLKISLALSVEVLARALDDA